MRFWLGVGAIFGLFLAAPALAQQVMAPAPASCERGENLGGNRSYQVRMPTASGHVFSFQVLEPAQFDCANRALGAHPLILHGPGYGGGRSTSGFAALRNAGYTVVSIDPRGYGDSGGTVRVMDPDFEGRDLVAMLDWLEQNLDYLAWRDRASGAFIARPADANSVPDGPNLVVGAHGGSYGGGYQLLLLAVDPKRRLDAIQPDITWHDLRFSLNPGDAIKSLWDLALSAAGEASGQQSVFMSRDPLDDGQDPFIKEVLARGIAANEFPRIGLDWFRYHSLSHWCAAAGLPHMPYPPYGPDAIPFLDLTESNNVPPPQANGRPGIGGLHVPGDAEASRHFEHLSVLLTQGMPDTLFTFSEAWWNAQCLVAAGADVRLYTHTGGHALPIVQAPDGLDSPVGGAGCTTGSLVAWFDAHLRPDRPEVGLSEVCFVLAGGDTVFLDRDEVLAPQPLQGLPGGQMRGFTGRRVSTSTPVPNGPAALANALGANAVTVPLGTVQAPGILAGIPTLDVTVSSLTGVNELAQDCGNPRLPTVRLGCDSIVYAGIGFRSGSAGPYKLMDDQLLPLRGLGRHRVDMVGVAERLPAGTQLALLLFGHHVQFFGNHSRDASIPAVHVNGAVLLPIYGLDGEGRPTAELAQTVLASNLPDTDGDGVFDINDQCPDTPAGTAVDDFGCPINPEEPAPFAVQLVAQPGEGNVDDAPLTVSFTATAAGVRPDAGQLRYTFHFGDGAHVGPQAAPTASHAYAQGVAGTYSAYVIVVDEQQRSAISPPVTVRTTVTVTVDPADPPLSAALAVRFRDDRTVVPAVVEFDASASTGPEGRLYRFDFGDGSQPRLTTEPGVTHVYTVPGTFTARVRVIDPEDAQRFSEAEAVLTIVSAQQTTAQLAVSPSRVRVGEPVTLDATASIAAPGRQITHFTFNLGDGRQVSRSVAEFGSQAGRLVVAYPVAGVYEPSVQVVDDGGTSALAKTQVQVSGHVGDGPGGPLPVTPPPTTPSPTAPPAPMPTPPLAPPTAEPSTAARSGGGGLSSGALAWLVVLAALSRRRRPAAST